MLILPLFLSISLLFFADHEAAVFHPVVLLFLTFWIGMFYRQLIGFLNLEAPFLIRTKAGEPQKLEIYTRSLRAPIIEDSQILRFSRYPKDIDIVFLPAPNATSFQTRFNKWLMTPIIPRAWWSDEGRIRIHRSQFQDEEAWDAFCLYAESYPLKTLTEPKPSSAT